VLERPAAKAVPRAVPKPWGRKDLNPWYRQDGKAGLVGEIWFERPAATGSDSPASSLLLKLLFTNEPLSIQVHPDDAYARSIGLPHGKAEAWYILTASPQAVIALGLTDAITPEALRGAVLDGSIADRVRWRRVSAGDAYYVAPGTIHSLGPGVVLLEVQQRSDATFRLFDFGRQRAMHADEAMAAASESQDARQEPRQRLDRERTVLVASPHFVLELVELPPATSWELNAMTETWVFVLDGSAKVGPLTAVTGDALTMDASRTAIDVHDGPWKCLLAYVGSTPDPGLLHLQAPAERSLPLRPQARA
jgi:mannose-6-phosphate isomerase